MSGIAPFNRLRVFNPSMALRAGGRGLSNSLRTSKPRPYESNAARIAQRGLDVRQ